MGVSAPARGAKMRACAVTSGERPVAVTPMVSMTIARPGTWKPKRVRYCARNSAVRDSGVESGSSVNVSVESVSEYLSSTLRSSCAALPANPCCEQLRARLLLERRVRRA